VSGCVAVDAHEAVVLSFCYTDDAVEISALEEGVEEEIVLGLPVLAAEGTVGELHVVGGFYVVVGEGESFIVPGVVGVLIARAEVNDFCTCTGLSKCTSYQLVEAFTFEDDGDGYW
jgi:hypothetical protein